MENKEFCMSSFLAFRYIEKKNMDFCSKYPYRHYELPDICGSVAVSSADEIDNYISHSLSEIKNKHEKIGLLLSGGMDSAILATYLSGYDAYTFRFLGGEFQKEELKRAESYAKANDMCLHYVDIEWESIDQVLDRVMFSKGGPVHSIEPQVFLAAQAAKRDGMDIVIIGDGADYVFWGMDKLISKDWNYEEFIQRYIYVRPEEVLNNYSDYTYLFDRYRDKSQIDYISFLKDVSTQESYGSYDNAFLAAGMPYYDPYAQFVMRDELDISRIRNGESKYLVRELYKKKYVDLKLPEKNPMPRPVDIYFKEWTGPRRPEFKQDIDISNYSGNQRWLMYCLERFLNVTGI